MYKIKEKNKKKSTRILFIVLVLAVTTAFSVDGPMKSDYCEGWESGYCEGWKDVRGQFAFCPIAPPCPIPDPTRDRFVDGYNRGFKAGSKAAEK